MLEGRRPRRPDMSNVETTMVYTHVVRDLRRPAQSPMDLLTGTKGG